MHHFEQPAPRRVVRKSVECCDFCWISGPQVQLAFQRNWNSRKQSETVGSGPAWSCQNCQSAFFLQKKTFRAIPFFFESATGNSWKQLGLVPLTRQKTSYLKPFKVNFLYKRVLNNSFFAESKVRAPTVSNCFPLHFQKKNGIARKVFFCKQIADWQFWHDQAGPLPTVSDCFSFSGTPVGPVDHWFNKNHNIQHFSSRPFCAQVARNDAFWLWNPIYPKNPKTPRPREIQYLYIYIWFDNYAIFHYHHYISMIHVRSHGSGYARLIRSLPLRWTISPWRPSSLQVSWAEGRCWNGKE